MKLVWLFMGFGTFLLAVSLNAELAMFVDLASVLVVAVPTLSLSFAFFGPKAVGSALRWQTNSDEDLETSIEVLRGVQNLARGCGCVGSLLGLVMMLARMDDPAKIGPAMAVALLSVLYGLFIAELLLGPLISRKLLPSAKLGNRAGNPPSSLVTFAIPLVLFAFAVLLSAF